MISRVTSQVGQRHTHDGLEESALLARTRLGGEITPTRTSTDSREIPSVADQLALRGETFSRLGLQTPGEGLSSHRRQGFSP